MEQNWVWWNSAMSPHPSLWFTSKRQNSRPVIPLQQCRDPSHAAPGRSEESSIVENLVLKIIHTKYSIISKRKVKNAQGQPMNRKRGLNSPNKLFADWIIHGKSRPHLEAFDSVCQPPLESEATSETLPFLRYYFAMLPQKNFHLELDASFITCPWHQTILDVRGKATRKTLQLVYSVII